VNLNPALRGCGDNQSTCENAKPPIIAIAPLSTLGLNALWKPVYFSVLMLPLAILSLAGQGSD
jgi:hypothetical protein